jgi:hypothetical protein
MRHGSVVAVLLLLPFLAIAGALAPGLVSIQYEEEEEQPELGPRERVPYRPVRLSRKPLLVPRDYSAGFVSEVQDLEQLFMGSQYRADVGERLTRLPSFPRSRGDMIVLDDVDIYLVDTLFKDVLQPGIVADATAVWNPALFDIIPNLAIPTNGGIYDDLTGQGDVSEQPPPPIIPEPRSGGLLLFGLIALAIRARKRQPATS